MAGIAQHFAKLAPTERKTQEKPRKNAKHQRRQFAKNERLTQNSPPQAEKRTTNPTTPTPAPKTHKKKNTRKKGGTLAHTFTY